MFCLYEILYKFRIFVIKYSAKSLFSSQYNIFPQFFLNHKDRAFCKKSEVEYLFEGYLTGKYIPCQVKRAGNHGSA